jgi:hypothetical protein
MMGESALTSCLPRRSRMGRREYRGGLGQIGWGTFALWDAVSAECITGGGART